ncbi:diguanylate cyclase [uncultured Cellulomonas sp.]|uniref:histidine kinase N-terminal 7TM domain-containing diguanylate cyclase n=1 Tax=uncultured Cellulomonas sp. TaxID=189682 RepID=UPI00260A268E|nr:diguanylate cyclase [uncultured Cellulomonas sp.]
MFRADPAGLAYACAAVVFAVVATVTWRRRASNPAVAAALVAAMLGACWWSLADAVGVAAVDETVSAVGWLAVFPGLGVAVIAFACLAGCLARPPWAPSRRLVLALAAEPAVVSLLAATNPAHQLVYRGAGAAELTGSAGWTYGPFFWVHSAYSYTVMLVGIVMVAHAWWTAPAPFRAQRLSMLVAVLVPAAANIVNLFDGLPLDVDPTPIGLSVTGVIIAWSVFRQDLITFTPVARGLILEHISDAIIAVGPAGRVIDANPAGVRLVRRLHPGRDVDLVGAVARDLVGAMSTTDDGATEVRVTLDGRPAELHVRSSALVGRKGRPLGSVLVIRDVTEVKAQSRRLEEANAQLTQQLATIERLRADLEEQASRDSLTGLHNRRYMVQRLEVLLARARDAARPLSVVLLDIDRFKRINDHHGHLAGDAVLVEAAGRIAAAAPPGALVARWGGEEFFVALPGADLAAGLAFAEQVRRDVEDRGIAVGDAVVPCTVSGGVATYPASGATAAQLFHAADLSLYEAKATGRNRVLAQHPTVPAPRRPSGGEQAPGLAAAQPTGSGAGRTSPDRVADQH